MSDLKFLPAATVQRQIKAVGNRAIAVEFAKKDGTITKRGGLPKVFKRRVGGDAGAKQAQTLKTHGLIFVDYAKPRLNSRGKLDAGFSFKADRVVALWIDGVEIRAR